MKRTISRPSIGHGAYTLPDAAKILRLDLSSLRRWIVAYDSDVKSGGGKLAGPIAFWGHGLDRGINFSSLIELYTVAQLRALGVSMSKIRVAREELADRFDIEHPFATEGLLTDGEKLLFELKEPDEESVLSLDRSGQTSFKNIIREFCRRIDFEASTELASRYWPEGRESSVVVDPSRAFGRPIIAGTSIPTETISDLIDAGENVDDVANLYQLEPYQIDDARKFEHRQAA